MSPLGGARRAAWSAVRGLAAVAAWAALVATAAIAPSPAWAEPPVAGLRHTSALGLRNNRLGLGVFSDTAWRVPLFRSEHPLLRDTYLDAGAVTQLSPANFHPGLFVETVPVAVLKLRASAQRLQYFGNFGNLSEYPDGDWSPTALTRANREGRGRRAGGYLYDARAMLRAKLWRIVASSEVEVSWYDFEASAPVVEAVSDMLVEPDGRQLQLRSTLGLLTFGALNAADSLILAAVHQHLAAEGTGAVRDLVGAAALYRPPADIWSVGAPAWALLVGTFARDPYRTGELYLGTLLTLTFERQAPAP